LFGFELQVSSSYFPADGNGIVNNVGERETAYCSADGNLTLEGDETITPGAKSEVEFVSAPFRTRGVGITAARAAANLAEELLTRADVSEKQGHGRRVRFHANDQFVKDGTVRGTWIRDCVIQVGARVNFEAKAQGTAGVPLGRLKDFFENAVKGDQQRTDDFGAVTARAAIPGGTSPELRGFLTACHYFLASAWLIFWQARRVDAQDGPLDADQRPGLWRTFAIKNDDLATARDGDEPAFYKDATGDCRIRVHRDSPKSAFGVLHRTDFHSMFKALPPADQTTLLKQSGQGIPRLVWPYDPSADPTSFRPDRIFRLPYRADPNDGTGRMSMYFTVPRDAPLERNQEPWTIAPHGPTLNEWWQSVLVGQEMTHPNDPQRRVKYPKDLASPPPGIRRRHPDLVARFPTSAENKNSYYGMGAFPIDRTAEGKPLAVFEHRLLDQFPKIRELGSLTPDKWAKLVEFFYESFVLEL
jgi:hypothetical protein